MYHSKHDPLTKPYPASSSFLHVASKKEFGSIGREVKPSVHPTRYLKGHEKTGTVDAAAVSLRESWFDGVQDAARAGHARVHPGCCPLPLAAPRVTRDIAAAAARNAR